MSVLELKPNREWLLLLPAVLVAAFCAANASVIPLLLLIVVPLIGLMIKRFEWGILALLFIIPFHYVLFEVIGQGILGMPRAVSAWKEGVLAIVLIGGLLSGRLKFKASQLLMLSSLYLGLVVINLARIPNLALLIECARASVQYTLLFFIISSLRFKRETLYKVLLAYAGVTAVVAAYGILQGIFGTSVLIGGIQYYPFMSVMGNRYHALSTFPSYNPLGQFLAASTLFYACLSDSVTKKQRLWLKGLMLLQLVCLVFTISRQAWLSVAIGLFVWYIVIPRRLVLGVLLMAVICVAVGLLADNYFITYASSILDMQDGKTLPRLLIWSQGFRTMSLWDWLVGRGLQAGGFVSQNLALESGAVKEPFVADNQYVLILWQMGIPGMALFFALVAAAFNQLRAGLQQETDQGVRSLYWGLLFAIGIYLFTGLFSNTLEIIPSNVFFWSLLGLMVAIRHNAKGWNQVGVE